MVSGWAEGEHWSTPAVLLAAPSRPLRLGAFHVRAVAWSFLNCCGHQRNGVVERMRAGCAWGVSQCAAWTFSRSSMLVQWRLARHVFVSGARCTQVLGGLQVGE